MDLPEVNDMLRDILFTSLFIDVFLRFKHLLSDNVRVEMLIHVYFKVKVKVSLFVT